MSKLYQIQETSGPMRTGWAQQLEQGDIATLFIMNILSPMMAQIAATGVLNSGGYTTPFFTDISGLFPGGPPPWFVILSDGTYGVVANLGNYVTLN
ncbi:MAG TPA: hypothetical protein VGM94_01105 [Galbitalea sp.]|jgi:hypothetical protein